MDVIALAVAVVDYRPLRGHARNRQVLPIQVGDQNLVVPDRLGDVVEARVGVLLQPQEEPQIVLVAVVVPVPEQPHAQLVILEQEPPEVGGEGLDSDPHRVEVIALRDVAQMVVEEGFLHAEEGILPVGAFRGPDGQDAPLRHADIAVVEGKGQTGLEIGRLERRRPFDQRHRGDECLGQDQAVRASEDVQAVRVLRGLDSDRQRQRPRLDHSVRHAGDNDEQILMARQRPVALERVLVIGVEPALVDTDRLDHPPAVGKRQMVRRKGLGRRRAHRAGIGLDDGLGIVFDPPWPATDRCIGVDLLRRLNVPGRLRHGGLDDQRQALRSGVGCREAPQAHNDQGGPCHLHHGALQTFCCEESRKGANGQLT